MNHDLQIQKPFFHEYFRHPMFCTLSKHAILIFAELYSRAGIVMKKMPGKSKKRIAYTKNNGEIILTYKHIKELPGVTRMTTRIKKALKELSDKGFIDRIPQVKSKCTHYMLDERYKDYDPETMTPRKPPRFPFSDPKPKHRRPKLRLVKSGIIRNVY